MCVVAYPLREEWQLKIYPDVMRDSDFKTLRVLSLLTITHRSYANMAVRHKTRCYKPNINLRIKRQAKIEMI